MRRVTVALAAAGVLLLCAADCGNGEPRTREDSYTCQAAKKQVADDPNDPMKQRQKREACS